MKLGKRFSALVVGVFVTLFPFNSLAQGPEFEKKKSERLAEIDQHMQKLQEHRACVSAALSQEALRKCGDDMREWRKDERDERREKREERKKVRGN